MRNNSLGSNKVPFINKRIEENYFCLVYQNNYSFLLKVGISYLKDEENAKEILQELFLKLWLKEFDKEIVSLDRYLFISYKNACLDFLRMSRNRQSVDLESHANVYFINQETPYSILLEKELAYSFSQALDCIPKGRRQVYDLSRNNGLKYKEIAKILQISTKTVETQISRSLSFLRSFLHLQLTNS